MVIRVSKHWCKRSSRPKHNSERSATFLQLELSEGGLVALQTDHARSITAIASVSQGSAAITIDERLTKALLELRFGSAWSGKKSSGRPGNTMWLKTFKSSERSDQNGNCL